MKKALKYRIAGWILVVLVVLALALGGTWIVMTEMGRTRLHRNASSQMPSAGALSEQEQTEGTQQENLTPDDAWQDDWIRYNGQVYDYNENIMTFLCMGVDVQDKITEKQTGLASGQADAIFLLVLNPDTKEIHIIAIDRNTMTEIETYDDDGNFTGVMIAQINLAHGYGDGKEQSAQYQVKAVSKLMYDLPIHGYCAINMAAIPLINDAVGGVDVTMLEDLPEVLPNSRKGDQIHLEGENAYWYVKYRDVAVEESARLRLGRQKQYLTAYINKAKEVFKKDVTLPITLFNGISGYMTTDVTVDEVVYLAGTAAGYFFSEENLIMLPGETDTSGRFDEFYVDEERLKQIIIETFYTPLEEIE